jgi:hypothetical protein
MDFNNLDDRNKYEIVVTSIIFPMYNFIKNKSTLVHVEMDLVNKETIEKSPLDNPNQIIEKIKPYCIECPIFRKKYRLIKKIIYYIHSIGYLKSFSGIFVHTKYSNDILFIHDRNIKERDRIIYLNIDDLVNKIKKI